MKNFTSLFYTFLIGALIAFIGVEATAQAAIVGGAATVAVREIAFQVTKLPELALFNMIGHMSIADLKRQAAELSNYNGDGVGVYTGAGDDLLDYTGNIANFAGEFVNHLEKQFVISLVNANAAVRTALLFAGYLKGNATLAPGQLVQGAFNDTGGNAGLTGATQSEKSIEELLLYLNEVPTRLLAMKIKSTVADQISLALTYQRNNPFRTEPTKIIRPDNFQNQDTFQDNQVTFPVNVQIDSQSKLTMPIAGSSTCYITFYFGTGINLSKSLERKAETAISNIQMVGKEKVIGAAVASKALLGTGI